MPDRIRINSELIVYTTAGELPGPDRELLEAAREAMNAAFAPYSRFHVGAAVRLRSGEIIKGNNQENISFPSGLCAERVALFYAHAQHPELEIDALAIVANSELKETIRPLAPCGACRQVMIETERNQNAPLRVIMSGNKGAVWVSENVQNLLPFYFDFDHIGLNNKL